MSLLEKARAAQQPATGTELPDEIPATAAQPLPDIEYTGAIAVAEQVPVYVAFARVMADVQSIGKNDKRDDVGGRYMFRGIDTVVNEVGPALRRHGVLCLPVKVFDVEYRDTKTKSGNTMQECTLKVKWLVIGPLGDTLPELLESAGQATDTQDKATSKATSVAQRVLFLSSLHVPTRDPDIDKSHDRGERPRPKPNDYRDEIVNPRTSLGRLNQIKQELLTHGLGEVLVTNENGDDELLGRMLFRFGRDAEGRQSQQFQVQSDGDR